MKRTALIAGSAAGLVLAGCGSAAKLSAGPPAQVSPFTVTALTTTTIAHPLTGRTVRCTSHGVAAGARVPSAGHGVGGSADGKSASATLVLTRRSDGSLVVSCTP
jgi:hypothetical protein